MTPIPSADSYSSHLPDALASPFPLATDVPLPNDFSNALSWISSSSEDRIRSFWADQLSALKTLASNPLCSSSSWYSLRPPSFAHAPSSLNVALVAQLSSFCDMGGAGWLEGYVKGFPISGSICQSGVFPVSLEPDNPHPLSRSSLFEGSAAL